ncbi:MAG: GntR family transcriptional regulator [Chitinophagaceae bacterium]|nr:GntR family transcriptional regulator [Chitinophagaceae bacterium]
MNIYQLIHLDERSVTPKYLQLANSLVGAVERGKIGNEYPLPSINDLSYELDISRDTAEKAYRYLKQLGIIGSVPGKGYFISKTDFRQRIKVFLLFNKLSAHKKIIYDAFAGRLGEMAAIDFYIYNNDFSLFKKLLQSRKEEYTHYVIIPHFLEGGEHAVDILDEIQTGHLVLLDKLIPNTGRRFGAVYENFEKDIYNALTEALPRLGKYHTLKIIFPSDTYFPGDILKGFHTFCQQYAFNHTVVGSIAGEIIREGEVYINLMEDDLVTLLEKIQATNLEVGRNIGIISYNETPWKRFILNGITTISTDFRKMGEMAAEMVMDNAYAMREVPFTLTLRPSL